MELKDLSLRSAVATVGTLVEPGRAGGLNRESGLTALPSSQALSWAVSHQSTV